jgi:hypothetical protein
MRRQRVRKQVRLPVIAVAPSGLDTPRVVDPRLAKPRLGLNYDRCYAADLRSDPRPVGAGLQAFELQTLAPSFFEPNPVTR